MRILKMDENNTVLVSIFLVIIAILLFSCIMWYGSLHSEKLRIDNFEKTIDSLSDEQKCIHICGFRFYGQTMFENYKFCMEKCDRISERLSECDKNE